MSPYATQLADAVDAAVADWVRRGVSRVLRSAGIDIDPDLERRIDAVAQQTRAWVDEELTAFLELDVDEQRTNPLAVLRAAVRWPTALLDELGVGEVHRDPFVAEAFPADRYALSPATWSDIDDSVHEPGIIWGAWKAKTVLDRRRAEGRR